MSKSKRLFFVPSDVNTAHDPAIIAAGPWPELLFRRANEHAKRLDRDGIIHAAELQVISRGIPAPTKQAAALVKHGLWEDVNGGWFIRSWFKWNLTQTEVADHRRKKQEAALRSHHSRGLHGETPDLECPICQEAPR